MPWDAGAFKHGSEPGPTPSPTPTPTPGPSPTPSPPVIFFALQWNAVPTAQKYFIYENGAKLVEVTAITNSLSGKVGQRITR